MKKLLKILSTLFTGFCVVIIVCLAVLVISVKASGGEPTIFGYQFKTVLSGSMEPTFDTGSIIAIELTDEGESFNKNDIVTFVDKDENLVTHRVTDIQQTKAETLYTTKGDNNEGADIEPVLSTNIVGKYAGYTIPYAGFLLNYANSKLGSALLLFIPGLLLFSSSILTLRRTLLGFKKEHEASTARS
ncbi:signal peptidase I [Halobacillus sp. A1]|uniref:signal peptidase I SipW n=1 Tax=Halobacillus sp. A1 TaxID=2880262 RepID=UPI0020A6B985|nr:signal peptidase I [Halobacillus sp. A1]MCP3032052.1 signal peptidase I [Halobacillus sp. A1]